MKMKEIRRIRGYFAVLVSEGLKVKSLKNKKLEPSFVFPENATRDRARREEWRFSGISTIRADF